MKKTMFAVSCLLSLCGTLSAKTPYMQRKQHIKQVVKQINALNELADKTIQQRDRLTAYLRSEQKKYRGKKQTTQAPSRTDPKGDLQDPHTAPHESHYTKTYDQVEHVHH